MNIDKKLELASEYVMNYLSNPSCENTTVSNVISVAWQYADAMEVEYNKRKQAEDKSNREAVRKLIGDDVVFLEKQGQQFDDISTIGNACAPWQDSLRKRP